MKLALVGYGRMGQEVERLVAGSDRHKIVTIQRKHIGQALDTETLRQADVVIDFTVGELVPGHIKTYCDLGIDAVIGTTGWDAQDVGLQRQVEQAGIGLIVGSNFSAGAQVFLQLVALASRQFHRLGAYDVYGFETHHAGKKDSPSGTAQIIATTIVNNFPPKTAARFDRADGVIDPGELHFASLRGGRNPGQHEVTFDSAADEVRLTHAAHSRSGFAEGALLAAEYIHGKQGYMFFEQLFQKGGPYAP
ncbi:MAG TPA: 4-hydroxy-tetrahydrodipicolinate reductase [Candidatus Limnocylindria bacterium]|nr:4-hydroxy-tetrahydrodipicolinate reductase [Candidatus Limnocylindria bacterium]